MSTTDIIYSLRNEDFKIKLVTDDGIKDLKLVGYCVFPNSPDEIYLSVDNCSYENKISNIISKILNR